LDSLAIFNDLKDGTIFQICKIYSPLSSTKGLLKLQKLSIQQECNNQDCGLFAIANMVEICYGNNPEDFSYDQNNYDKKSFRRMSFEQRNEAISQNFKPRYTSMTREEKH